MGIVTRSLELFRSHLWAFLAISVGPVLATGLIGLLLDGQQWPTRLLFTVVSLFVYLVTWSATSLLASGALLGHPPDVATAWRCALRSPIGRLLTTSIVILVLMMAGFIALIVPGFIVMAQLLLVPAVVVFERLGTWDSVRRSRMLGSGFHARNLGIVFVLFLPPVLAFFLLKVLGAAGTLADIVAAVLSSALEGVSMVATLLIYVDMRRAQGIARPGDLRARDQRPLRQRRRGLKPAAGPRRRRGGQIPPSPAPSQAGSAIWAHRAQVGYKR